MTIRQIVVTAGFGLAALFALIVGFTGCHNASTPAGYMGYITRGAVFGKEQFIGVQQGPTSTGLGWMLRTKNISITPYTYSEPMTVLSKDNLKITFAVHIVWRVKASDAGVRHFVEKYTMFGGNDDETKTEEVVKRAYDDFLKEPLRTSARNEVQSRDALLVKDQNVTIGRDIEGRIKTWVGDAPFEIMSVVVGDISYPDEVANAVAKKMATTQLLEQKSTEISIEQKQSEMRIIQAEGIAKAMDTINQKLTPFYLQHEAIEAQRAMVNSPNHTTIYIPVGPNGVPITGTFDAAGRHSAPAAAAGK